MKEGLFLFPSVFIVWHCLGTVEAVASARLPVPECRMSYTPQSPSLLNGWHSQTTERLFGVLGSPKGLTTDRRASPPVAYNRQNARDEKNGFSPVIHSLHAVSGSIRHHTPSRERKTRTFLGDYGLFLPLLVQFTLCFVFFFLRASYPLSAHRGYIRPCTGHVVCCHVCRCLNLSGEQV